MSESTSPPSPFDSLLRVSGQKETRTESPTSEPGAPAPMNPTGVHERLDFLETFAEELHTRVHALEADFAEEPVDTEMLRIVIEAVTVGLDLLDKSELPEALRPLAKAFGNRIIERLKARIAKAAESG